MKIERRLAENIENYVKFAKMRNEKSLIDGIVLALDGLEIDWYIEDSVFYIREVNIKEDAE